MSIYAIGDVQGCYDELQELLALVKFDPAQDTLWFAGDLINRGPHSLQTLRFIKSLPRAVVVLGNHDIHLLALANGHPFRQHTLHEVLAAPDCQELVDWLRRQPLLHYDAGLGYVMTHAGLLPQWSLAAAAGYAKELEAVLQRDDYATTLEHLYGNQPDCWEETLAGWGRLRFIMNAFTRMRFCTPHGKLDFGNNGPVGTQLPGYYPWFELPRDADTELKIVFGHWAALAGVTHNSRVFALDTGCAWGGSLTAMRLEDSQRFSVRSKMVKVKS
jgi:bis(5'-nucleosyl)-tetraphosphatase (symmetrical)